MTDVTIATLPQMTVAGLRRIISDYNAEGVLWQEIMPLLEKSGTRLPDGGIGGATYHDADYREADVDVEVWAPFDAAPPLECRTLPTQRIVTTTVRGDYSQMPAATTAIGAYIAEHGLRTGPMFNIYRVSPAQSSDPSSWVTDVCFPILDR